MRIKTNANPELNLVLGDGLEKKGSNPASIEKEKWEFLKAAYATVKQGKNNEYSAVMTLGNSTFLFAYDEDSKQDVLFVDGYLVTKMTLKGNKVNVFTTNSNKEYKSFEEKELVTKYMADLDNGIKAENDLRAAKEEVVAYFETKKIEKPILENARNEVSSREEKIKELENQIKGFEKEVKKKSKALKSIVNDNNSRQGDKIVKKFNKEIDALKDKIKECNNQIIAVGKELDNEKDAKLSKKLTNEIKTYKDEIAELEKAKEENNTKIGDAENKIVLLEARAKDMNEGKTVAPNSELKSKQEYRNEIKKLNAANEKIDAQLTTLNEKVAAVEKAYVNNLGIKAQFAEA